MATAHLTILMHKVTTVIVAEKLRAVLTFQVCFVSKFYTKIVDVRSCKFLYKNKYFPSDKTSFDDEYDKYNFVCVLNIDLVVTTQHYNPFSTKGIFMNCPRYESHMCSSTQ